MMNGHVDPKALAENVRVVSGRALHAPIPVCLPSGLVVELRPLGFELVLKSKRLPDLLTPLILDAINGRESAPLKMDEMRAAEDFIAALDLCCELAFVNPRIVATPQAEDECSVDDIELQDKYFVWQILGRPRRWLETFRVRQAPDVESLDNLPGLQGDAESVSETETPASP